MQSLVAKVIELVARNKTKLIWHFLIFLLISKNFESSQGLKEKGTDYLQKGPWKNFNCCNQVLGAMAGGESFWPAKFR